MFSTIIFEYGFTFFSFLAASFNLRTNLKFSWTFFSHFVILKAKLFFAEIKKDMEPDMSVKLYKRFNHERNMNMSVALFFIGKIGSSASSVVT